MKLTIEVDLQPYAAPYDDGLDTTAITHDISNAVDNALRVDAAVVNFVYPVTHFETPIGSVTVDRG
jgi:hypothetical protein